MVAGGATVVVVTVVGMAPGPSGRLGILDEVVEDHDPLVLLGPERVQVVDVSIELLLGLDGSDDRGG